MKIRETSVPMTALAVMTIVCAALVTMPSASVARDRDHDGGIEHVLLISVDGADLATTSQVGHPYPQMS
jgi:hypothetical protein